MFRAFNGRGNIGLDLDKMRSNKGNEKYDPILMDGDVINVLRHENTVAIRETGTRKTCRTTLVTSAGLKPSKYRWTAEAEVTLDDLFSE